MYENANTSIEYNHNSIFATQVRMRVKSNTNTSIKNSKPQTTAFQFAKTSFLISFSGHRLRRCFSLVAPSERHSIQKYAYYLLAFEIVPQSPPETFPSSQEVQNTTTTSHQTQPTHTTKRRLLHIFSAECVCQNNNNKEK